MMAKVDSNIGWLYSTGSPEADMSDNPDMALFAS